MLQIALAPAPVAGGEIRAATAGIPRNCRRACGAMWIAQPARRISAASMKSWLRIWPPNGLRPRQFGQARILRESAHPDDGVVAPVISFRAVPPGDAGGNQRAIKPAGKLLQRANSVLALTTIGSV